MSRHQWDTHHQDGKCSMQQQGAWIRLESVLEQKLLWFDIWREESRQGWMTPMKATSWSALVWQQSCSAYYKCLGFWPPAHPEQLLRLWSGPLAPWPGAEGTTTKTARILREEAQILKKDGQIPGCGRAMTEELLDNKIDVQCQSRFSRKWPDK